MHTGCAQTALINSNVIKILKTVDIYDVKVDQPDGSTGNHNDFFFFFFFDGTYFTFGKSFSFWILGEIRGFSIFSFSLSLWGKRDGDGLYCLKKNALKSNVAVIIVGTILI